MINVHGSSYLIGAPDVLACLPPSGRMLAVECKRPGGKVTKLQSATLRKIEQSGGVALIAVAVSDVKRAIDDASTS